MQVVQPITVPSAVIAEETSPEKDISQPTPAAAPEKSASTEHISPVGKDSKGWPRVVFISFTSSKTEEVMYFRYLKDVRKEKRETVVHAEDRTRQKWYARNTFCEA